MNKKTSIQAIVMFYCALYLVDAFNVYLSSKGYFKIENTVLSVVFDVLKRLMIWSLPVLLLLKNPFDYLKLNENFLKGVMVGLFIGISLLLLRAGGLYLFKGSVEIDLDLPPHVWWSVIIFVGFSEEVVFRGYLLQKIQEISSFWTANIATTGLFILMHVPYWVFVLKYDFSYDMLSHSLSILWLSLLFGFVFKKTNSLWACIVIHSINNFMTFCVK